MDYSREKSTRLDNGAKMISFCAPHLHTVSFSVVLPFVPEYTPGVYHLVEHLFFERAGARRAEQINAEMTAHGSEIDGYTSVNYMCFRFTCREETFVPQLRLLYDMLTQKEYGEEELQKVLPVIENEIFENGFYDGRAGDVLCDLWFDSRYASSILGDSGVLGKVADEEIASARESLFTTELCVFLAGGFTAEDEKAVSDTFGKIPLKRCVNTPPRTEERQMQPLTKIGRGRELQVLVTYHEERADYELKMAAHWLRSALFDGLDAAAFRYFDGKGFPFYSIEGNYNVRGDELLFSYLVHIEKRDKKYFLPLIDGFERAAEKTDFISLVRPYLYENLILLPDNPENLCGHYVNVWQDMSCPVTLKEESEFCGAFTNERLARCWRTISRSLRRVFLIGR